MPWRLVVVLSAIVAVAACTSAIVARGTAAASAPFRNPYVVPEDKGERVPGTYFLKRAWVQITRDLDATDVPPTVPLDVDAMAG